MEFLLSLVESDPVPFVRFKTLELLWKNPPFTMGRAHRLDTMAFVDRLWNIMNSQRWDRMLRFG